VTPRGGVNADGALSGAPLERVTKQIGAIAKPKEIRFTEALPKTRSGNIMRRLLRATRPRSRTTRCSRGCGRPTRTEPPLKPLRFSTDPPARGFGVEPSAKGAIVMGVVAGLRKLRSAGVLTDEQLAARLSGPALALLDQKIEVARWYPIGVFRELVDFQFEVVGKRDPEYARQEGARSADLQFESGRYQQLDFAKRAGRAESTGAIVLQAKLIASLTAAFYNFLETNVGIDPENPHRLQIVYTNAALFPDALRYATEGFMSRINERQGSTRGWLSERTMPDRIVFWMDLPGRLSSR
jgi:hypothetical protein